MSNRSSSLSTSSTKTGSSGLPESGPPPLTPPPTSPLPPLPTSTPKLLPRSRSTSMSLKAPPTSSSFFDLYEQLGIWPGSEKPEEKPAERDDSPTLGDLAPTRDLPDPPQTLSESPSVTFSSASWEAAIGAFPVFEDYNPPTSKTSLDFGLAYASDDFETLEEVSDRLSSIAAAGSSSASTKTVTTVTTSSSDTARATTADTTLDWSGTYYGVSKKASGSGSTSRSGARRTSIEAGFSDSGTEDDIPLSQLHPGALQARKDARREKRQLRQDKNPGVWDGEGGVPADALSNRLEKVVSDIVASPQERGDYPWAAAAIGGPSRSQVNTQKRSATDPLRIQTTNLDRNGRPSSAGQSGIALTPLLPSASPLVETSHSEYPRRPETQESMQTPEQPTQSRQQISRQPSAPTPRLPHSLPTPLESRLPPTLTKQRSRAISTSASGPRHGTPDDENMLKAVTTSALCHLTYVKAFVGGLDGVKVTLELGAETSSRHVLVAALEKGVLQGVTQGMSWVICEVFAERGMERQVREYEQLQSVVKGWDGMAKFNCFVFRQSNRGVPTWMRAIPSQAPFFGAYVQWEKRGKWSKRWLETRGGQVFLAKNEKNKDEVHVSTSFIDVYTMTRAYKAPKPFVFVLKRIEPASTFEDPQDYCYTFSSDEATAWKLMSAIYDAKSFDLARTQPQLLAAHAPPPPPTLTPKPFEARGRRPTVSAGSHAPLVDLPAKQDRSAFTGRGLLKI